MQDYSYPANTAMQFFPVLKEATLLEVKVNKEKPFSIPKWLRNNSFYPNTYKYLKPKEQKFWPLEFFFFFLQSTSGTSMNSVIKM